MNEGLQSVQVGPAGFKLDQVFAGLFDAPLPSVMRFQGGNNVHAGGQAGIQGSLGQLASGAGIGRGDPDHGKKFGAFHGL